MTKKLALTLLTVQLITCIVMICLVFGLLSDVRGLNKYLKAENDAAEKASEKRVEPKRLDEEFIPANSVCPCGSGSRGWIVTHPGHEEVQVCIVCYKTRAPG